MSTSKIDMDIPFIVLICINVLLLGPISIGLLLKYGRHVDDNEHIYTARRPKIVLLQGIVAVLFMSVYLPIHIIFFEILWDNNDTFGGVFLYYYSAHSVLSEL